MTNKAKEQKPSCVDEIGSHEEDSKLHKSGIFFHGESLDRLRRMEDESVQLAITSPPYNVGKSYEKKSSLDCYLEEFVPFAGELFRILSSRGSLAWQVGNYVSRGEVYPLDIFFYDIFKKAGFRLRNRIVWHFGHGLHATHRLSGRYETLLWFTKGDTYTWNLDSIRVPSKYPNKKHFKGPKRGQLSGNPLGKNPSDVWKVIQDDWSSGFWDVPNVKNNHPEKTIHPCSFPIEIAERCVLAMTNPGDVVLDPFCGVGTSVIAAVKNGRNGIGIERDENYVSIAKQRLTLLEGGHLPCRPIGKPIHSTHP